MTDLDTLAAEGMEPDAPRGLTGMDYLTLRNDPRFQALLNEELEKRFPECANPDCSCHEMNRTIPVSEPGSARRASHRYHADEKWKTVIWDGDEGTIDPLKRLNEQDAALAEAEAEIQELKAERDDLIEQVGSDTLDTLTAEGMELGASRAFWARIEEAHSQGLLMSDEADEAKAALNELTALLTAEHEKVKFWHERNDGLVDQLRAEHEARLKEGEWALELTIKVEKLEAENRKLHWMFVHGVSEIRQRELSDQYDVEVGDA